MIKKIHKNIIIILFVIITICNIEETYALSLGWATVSSGGSSSSTTTPADPKEQCPNYYQAYNNACPNGTPIEYTNNGIDYTCTYNYSINPSTNIEIESYDMKGNPLLKTVYVDNTFPSGTWIGIENKETRKAIWNINDYKYFKVTYDYTCFYSAEITTGGNCLELYSPNSKTIDDGGTPQHCLSLCRSNGYNNGAPGFDTGTCRCTNPKCKKYSSTSTRTDTIERKYEKYPKNWSCPLTARGNNGYTYTLDESKSSRDQNTEEIRYNIPNNLKEYCTNNARTIVETRARSYVTKPTSVLKFIDTNTYSENNISNYINKIEAKGEGIKCENCTNSGGTTYQIFNYYPSSVCLNILTSNVTYKLNSDKCGTNEVNVTFLEGKKYWRYFIPLNTKSGSNFFISVEKSGENESQLDIEECNSVVERYPIEKTYKAIIESINGNSFTNNRVIDLKTVDDENGCRLISVRNHYLTKTECRKYIKETNPAEKAYKNYIKQKNGKPFVGDYYASYIKENGYSKSEDKKAIEKQGGCIFSTSINYQINQQFYGEEKKSGYTSLKGYGMYFRQIDINNPFPNGIDSNSIWNGRYNASNKEVNTGNGSVTLSDFKNITYKANVSIQNANTIKDLNDNYSYTSWKNKNNNNTSGMNINGTSNFVRNNQNTIFTINNTIDNKTNPYKLGCGPANYNTWSWCKS